MQEQPEPQQAQPVAESERIDALDLIRGVAVLGILLMNVVAFKLMDVAYFNFEAPWSQTTLDWAVGVFGEIFVDQKFMAIFSALFGAGILLFIDRAAAKGGRAALLSLWRNVLLLAMGILHMLLLFDGDVLTLYAICAPVLLLLRRSRARTFIVAGAVIFLASVPLNFLWQGATGAGTEFGRVWTGEAEYVEGSIVDAYLIGPYFFRALGMMLIGCGLYRTGFLRGALPDAAYRRTAAVGIPVGLGLGAAGVVFLAANDYSADVAMTSFAFNNLGTIPAALGYVSLIILWSRSADSWLKQRLQDAGRMALTNYIAQSVLANLVLLLLLAEVDVGRTGLALFVVAVWVVQLLWSGWWMARRRFGPLEWLWRTATYRRRQPLRKA